MFVRRSLAGVLSATVVGSALVLVSTGTAHAAVDPDDTTFTPVAADLVGVGSDTSQNALFRLANAYNATTPTPANRLVTLAATGGGDITLRAGVQIARPNGSGAGKGRLYGANDTADVDFARSSSELNAAEANAGLQAFPFALDSLGVAVSGSTASNAPAGLTGAQILGIYKGDLTTWNQVGGTSSATIKPLIPQDGSGTRSFFLNELKALNGGTTVTLGVNVAVVQENDPAPLRNDANAVGPFSIGRAGLLGGQLRIPTGFKADRALYNVVRGTDASKPEVTKVFGPAGFVCSDAALPLIEAAGFKQLATAENDGVCGEATQAKTTDFTTNEPVVAVDTRTTVAGVSTAARALRLTARVAGSSTPAGSVQFLANGTVLGSVGLSGGTAVLSRTGVAPGRYAVTARFVPASGSAYVASQGAGTVTVKAASSVKESFPAAVARKAKVAKGAVTVTFAGTSAKPSGKVTLKEGAKTVGTGVLRNGTVTITLKRAKVGAGKSTLKAVYGGDANGFGSSKSFTVTFKK
ncbi:hypothetical protein FE634_05660 [Nocardioides dongxiaopingii]|uniref:PstS family phosphate ABC transporter substrate-binding protein n=1 Tax=Nocardioides sp. S-1144 TaxID=2582905 RepID=UPI0011641AA7|nr:substrate-binding domain-containing protein [Nocardioides sp. S-1144]QCW50020.2 hypothetical protein FE634_05660 [Nocardioides sp. S-1144]